MIAIPSTLFGHAFGQDFSLPLPIWMFIYGGAAAVLLSFVLFGLLYDDQPVRHIESSKRVSSPIITLLGIIGKWISVILFIVAIVAGLIGNPDTGQNFNVTFFWVIFFVGFTYVTALFGNIWKSLNPMLTIVEITERVCRKRFTGIKPYPIKLGYYPAIVVYFVLICIELLFDSVGTLPQSLSGLMICYALASVSGCILLGKTVWFRYIDFFSVYFGLVSKLSAFAYRGRKVIIRKPFSGLLEKWPDSISLVLFIVFMLVSTSFDGLTETKQYKQIFELLPSSTSSAVYGMTVLIGLWLLVFALYVLFMALARIIAKTKVSVRKLCVAFSPSLVPIAIGYNVAHYFSYFVTNGQRIIKQASDPFDAGWNLFGTAGYTADASVLSTYTTWYVQVAAIVIGHVVAVYIAHRIAVRIFESNKHVVLSQIPMVLLMVLYTTASLWIIAQPVYIAQEKSKEQEKVYQQFLETFRQPPMPLVPTSK